ncbi:MAG: radical SAM protein, partial [Pseudomonadales bacterium]
MPNKRSDKMTDTVPLGLYIHFPWCIRKCPYCDFNSHEVQGEAPQAAYLARLLQDLREDYLSESHSLPESRPFSSVFVGGGTPSLFMPDLLAKLLVEATALSGALGEVTLEANPGAVDAQRFAAYRTAGVTRLSLGFQSM